MKKKKNRVRPKVLLVYHQWHQMLMTSLARNRNSRRKPPLSHLQNEPSAAAVSSRNKRQPNQPRSPIRHPHNHLVARQVGSGCSELLWLLASYGLLTNQITAGHRIRRTPPELPYLPQHRPTNQQSHNLRRRIVHLKASLPLVETMSSQLRRFATVWLKKFGLMLLRRFSTITTIQM